MLAATKLRRGMIPKDKERGMWNIESRGEAMCHHHPWLFLLVSWGSDWLAGRPLPSPRLLSSPRRRDRSAHSLGWWLFVFLMQDGDKMFYHPLCWGWPPLSSANCRSVVLFFPSTQRTNFCLHALDCGFFFIHHSGSWAEIIGIVFPLIDGCGFPHALLTELPTMQHW